MSGVAGRSILITGALGSLGAAQCVRLAKDGPARLVLLDLDNAEGEQRAAALSRETGLRCDWLAHDLADLDATEALARQLGAEGIDCLVHNAAQIVNRPFEEFSPADYEMQMRVNSASLFALARGLAPSMKARGEGRIVAFTSLTLNGRWEGYAPYVASKGAVLGLTKTLARELGPHGIRVNAVAPGAVVSHAEARVFGDRAAQYDAWIRENQSLKDRIQPDDVAALVRFLLSDDARMITGQNIGIDGGW